MEIKDKYAQLLNLHERLNEVKKLKKNAAADYRDQVHDIEDEIQDLVNELREDQDAVVDLDPATD